MESRWNETNYFLKGNPALIFFRDIIELFQHFVIEMINILY